MLKNSFQQSLMPVSIRIISVNLSPVAVWEVIDKEIRIVEIKYVGTHEKAPY